MFRLSGPSRLPRKRSEALASRRRSLRAAVDPCKSGKPEYIAALQVKALDRLPGRTPSDGSLRRPLIRSYLWPHRLVRPRTSGFHPGNRGSNPLGVNS